MILDSLQRISEEQVSQLNQKYGRVKLVTYNGVDMVFRKPKRHECQQYLSKQDNPQEKIVADEQLAQLLIVNCGGVAESPVKIREAFNELLDEYPMMCRSAEIGGAMARLTGVMQDQEAKNYGSASTASDSLPRTTPEVSPGG